MVWQGDNDFLDSLFCLYCMHDVAINDNKHHNQVTKCSTSSNFNFVETLFSGCFCNVNTLLGFLMASVSSLACTKFAFNQLLYNILMFSINAMIGLSFDMYEFYFQKCLYPVLGIK
jgi:hypothetical protein